MNSETRKKHERNIYDKQQNVDRPSWDSIWDQELYQLMFDSSYRKYFDQCANQFLLDKCVLILGASLKDVQMIRPYTSNIVALNISERELSSIRNGYPEIETIHADAETFEHSRCYDAIFCRAILHHLHPFETVITRFPSLLCSDGVLFVASEPGYYNPFAMFARKFAPTSEHTPGEKPFVFSQFNRILANHFHAICTHYFFLFSMIWPYLAKKFPALKGMFRVMLQANLFCEKIIVKLRIFNNLFWVIMGVYRKKS